jgi:uncharacterized protein YoxC
MRNKRLFQQRLETLDAIFSAIKNGIQMGASVGEIKTQVDKGSTIVSELEGYVENEN